jgi:hypothetical protein
MDDFGSLEFFKGNWSFTRIVTIGSSGQLYASARGDAGFEQEADGGQSLIYTERGLMELEHGTSLRFSRSYRYSFAEGGIKVFFNDGPDCGSLYQTYSLSEDGLRLEMECVHLCGADQYRGDYCWQSDNAFHLRTIVTGAAKDLVIETDFFRVDDMLL